MILYIDPGTGSMLFSLLIGIAMAAVFGVRTLFVKFKFFFTGGKGKKEKDAKKIPIVIFSDHKRYFNVFKGICDEAEKRGLDLVYYTASPDDPVLSADYKHTKAEFIGEGNKPYSKLNFLHADIVLATTPGLDVYQWKRSKDVKYYVHIPHVIDDLTTYRMFALDYFDSVLLNGKHQEEVIRFLEKKRNLPAKELPVVGSTFMDEHLAKYNARSTSAVPEKKIILVAPSWGKSGILSRFGSKLLRELCKTGYEIVVRPHPQSLTSEKELLESIKSELSGVNNLSWNFDNDNFDILNKSSLLITDFSGIILDYTMVFDKPLIYADTNFDTMPYDADWLEDEIWIFKAARKLGVQLKEEDFGSIGDVIEKALSSTSLQVGRDEVRSICWEQRGKAAANVVDYLEKKLASLNNI